MMFSMLSCQTSGLFGTKADRELRKEERKVDLEEEIENNAKNAKPAKTSPAVQYDNKTIPKPLYDR